MVKLMAIHWFDLEINRYMPNGHFISTAAHANSTMFLTRVCVLVSFTASPKHPQSLTGLAMATHRVTMVMPAINSSDSSDTRRRRMANRMKMPSENSNADKIIDRAKVTVSGTTETMPNAPR